jgi:hypothetical protein
LVAAGAGAAPAAPAEPVRMSLFNIYRSMLHSVSEEADYHFVFEGLARLLNNIPNADSTYLPYSTKKVRRGWMAISLRRGLSCCFGRGRGCVHMASIGHCGCPLHSHVVIGRVARTPNVLEEINIPCTHGTHHGPPFPVSLFV